MGRKKAGVPFFPPPQPPSFLKREWGLRRRANRTLRMAASIFPSSPSTTRAAEQGREGGEVELANVSKILRILFPELYIRGSPPRDEQQSSAIASSLQTGADHGQTPSN